MNTSRSFVDRVKANPLPTAMVGVGLWLLFRNSNDHTSAFESDNFYDRYGYDRNSYDRGYGSPYGYGRRTAGVEFARDDDSIGERMSGAVDSAKERISDTVDDTRERISDAMEHGRERVSDLTDEARDRAWELSRRANRGLHRTEYAARDLFLDNPLAIGAAAIALGAIIGAAIPESDRERELMGSAAGRVTSQAKEIALEKMDQAKDVASAAATAAKNAARDEAKATGLTDTPSTGTPRTDISGSGVGMGNASDRGFNPSPGSAGSGMGTGSGTPRSATPGTRPGTTGAGIGGGSSTGSGIGGATPGRSGTVPKPPASNDPNRRR